MLCCPIDATLRQVQTITTALTSAHGVQARTASPAVGLPSLVGGSDNPGTGTGTPASSIAVAASLPKRVFTKCARYCSTSRGFQTWTKPMTQSSETSEASTSGNCGPRKLETANCVKANDPPATRAAGHIVLKLRKPVKMMSA